MSTLKSHFDVAAGDNFVEVDNAAKITSEFGGRIVAFKTNLVSIAESHWRIAGNTSNIYFAYVEAAQPSSLAPPQHLPPTLTLEAADGGRGQGLAYAAAEASFSTTRSTGQGLRMYGVIKPGCKGPMDATSLQGPADPTGDRPFVRMRGAQPWEIAAIKRAVTCGEASIPNIDFISALNAERNGSTNTRGLE